jgi:hypothetical protein
MKAFLPDYALAELRVLSVQQRSATTMIVKSVNVVHRGDVVTRLLRNPVPTVQDLNVQDPDLEPAPAEGSP